MEWRRRLADDAHPSVATAWKAEQRARLGPDAPLPEVRFDVNTLPGIRLSDRLPKQDNDFDCGLFLLAYLEFFTAGNPSDIVLNGGNASGHNAKGRAGEGGRGACGPTCRLRVGTRGKVGPSCS